MPRPITENSTGGNAETHEAPRKRMDPLKDKIVGKRTQVKDVPRVLVRKSTKIMNHMNSPSKKKGNQVVQLD